MPAYRPVSIAQAWAAVMRGEVAPRIAIGNFLDDWRRVPDPRERMALIAEPIPDSDDPGLHRWSAFVAAMVEHLARRDTLPPPPWVDAECWVLAEPWLLTTYWKLRPWILVATPPAWKRRGIFGGDESTLIGRV